MSIVIIFRSIHDSLDSRDGNFLLSIVGIETVDLLFDITSGKALAYRSYFHNPLKESLEPRGSTYNCV